MNERMKVLMGFAGLQLYYDSQDEAIKKFAELIVQECVDVICEDGGATHHRELLFTHFGVKE